MGLLTHGLAAGLGYLLGRPDGRERLTRLGRQAADLAQRPEVVQVRERAQDQIKNQANAVKQKVAARSDAAVQGSGSDAAGSEAAPARPGLRARTWRSRFSRSGTAHFPSSAEARAAGAEDTIAVEEAPAPPTR